MSLWSMVAQRTSREVACVALDGNDPPALLQAFSKDGQRVGRIVDDCNDAVVEFLLSDLETALPLLVGILDRENGQRFAASDLICDRCMARILERAAYFVHDGQSFCGPDCCPQVADR